MDPFDLVTKIRLQIINIPLLRVLWYTWEQLHFNFVWSRLCAVLCCAALYMLQSIHEYIHQDPTPLESITGLFSPLPAKILLRRGTSGLY